jgi:glycosyltransferase involved in cell wall biosynthesis
VEAPNPDAVAVQALQQRFDLKGKPVVGFAARFATEKGVEYMLQALPRIVAAYPDVQLLFAGEHENVLGEEAYRRRLQPLLDRYADRWRFLGVLDARQMAAFYAACDVTVLPSINSTESFGLVQVESMLCGTPVVASNLPGVRIPIRTTGMGEIVAPRDAAGLAAAVVRVLSDKAAYLRPRAEVVARFSTERTREEYLALFSTLRSKSAATGVMADSG